MYLPFLAALYFYLRFRASSHTDFKFFVVFLGISSLVELSGIISAKLFSTTLVVYSIGLLLLFLTHALLLIRWLPPFRIFKYITIVSTLLMLVAVLLTNGFYLAISVYIIIILIYAVYSTIRVLFFANTTFYTDWRFYVSIASIVGAFSYISYAIGYFSYYHFSRVNIAALNLLSNLIFTAATLWYGLFQIRLNSFLNR